MIFIRKGKLPEYGNFPVIFETGERESGPVYQCMRRERERYL
jgi:hypothetical protein